MEIPDPCGSYEVEDRSKEGGERGTITGTLRVWPPASEEASHPWLPLPALIRAGEAMLAAKEEAFAPQARALPTPRPPPIPPPAVPPAATDLIPGEALLEMEGDEATIRATVARLHEQPGLEGYRFSIGAFATTSLFSVRFRPEAEAGRVPDPEASAEVIAHLARHPALRSAGPHPRLRPAAAPDDPLYRSQWYLRQLGMDAAWAFTTGSEKVVVAVIDNGVAPHEDLWERLLPGYDFVSDPALAADGDGRDPDPAPASALGIAANWHGQQVAGVIGATADNGRGIVGMDWKARILPVRVASENSASLADAIAGMQWAAGLPVPGVPSNPWPAAVINVSLAGRADPSPAVQRALDGILATGATIVAGVGNEAKDVAGIIPAAYDGVIAVGASDATGSRANYSNAGPEVDLLAPGGASTHDWDGDGLLDHILTLNFHGRLGTSHYAQFVGTSMAAPMVSGAIALLKALRPELDPTAIRALLRETAHPFAQCEEGCGAGLLNPAGLLARAGATAESRSARLSLGSDWLHLGGNDKGTLLVSNLGGETLHWSVDLDGPEAGRVELGRTNGNLAPYATEALAVELKRDGLAPGRHQVTLTFLADAEAAEATLSFDSEWSPSVEGALVGAFRYEGCKLLLAGTKAIDPLGEGGYQLDLPPGRWILLAIADRDGDGALGSGDLIGAYRYVDGPSFSEAPADGTPLQRNIRLHPIP